jgi:ABC-type transporter MlaC component
MACLTILPVHADSSAKTEPAESYIADFFRATVETAVTPRSDEYATKAVKILLLRAVPLDETARFMLGRNLHSDNKQGALRFQEQFQDFVAEVITMGIRANPTVGLQVEGSRPRTDGSFLVLSSLNLPSGTAIPVNWQVAQNPADGTFQVTKIDVAGIDAAIMLRTIATTALSEGQTDVDGLIPWFRAALERRSGEAAPRATVTSP